MSENPCAEVPADGYRRIETKPLDAADASWSAAKFAPIFDAHYREQMGLPPAPPDPPRFRPEEWPRAPLFEPLPHEEPATLEEARAELRRERQRRHEADMRAAHIEREWRKIAGELHALENDLEWPPREPAAQHGTFMDVKVYEDPTAPPWSIELRQDLDRRLYNQLLYGTDEAPDAEA